MHVCLVKSVVLIALIGLGGCKTPEQSRPRIAPSAPTAQEEKKAKKPEQATPDVATRNSALALLADLLKDEKDLSKLLIIKRESVPVNRLIKDISDSAAYGYKLLESFEQQESRLHLAGTGLPPGEAATRAAIAKTKQHVLLHGKGIEFELQLLLTQTEALNYGAHLAQVAAENEPNSARAQQLSNLASVLRRLYGQTAGMLRTR